MFPAFKTQVINNQYIKKILCFGACFFCIQVLICQTSISGKIKDGRGHPVPGVSITIKNSFDGATSD
ncbi:MAG: carboxypeptidase-like regulatory domain-containing protein, partial [Chitinophagales bacterium]